MLTKQNRIPRLIFKSTLKGAQFVNSPHLTFYYKNPKNKEKKFSFVISKNVAKKVVARNLIRRWGYSIIQKNLVNIKNGVLGIFFIKKKDPKFKFMEFEKEIVNLLKKSKII